MLIDFALAILLLFALTSVGLPLIPGFCKVTGVPRLLLAAITCLTLLVTVASWIAALNLSIKFFWATVIALMLNLLVNLKKLRRNLVNLSIFSLMTKGRILTLGSVGLFVTSLHNPTFFSQFVSFRNGPDLVGWTKGAQFFCTDSRISDLNSRIISTLGAEKFTQTLTLPGPLNEFFLYRLPSFSDQIAAEFLLGAHRTGLPAFLGALCNVLPDQNVITVVSAIHCLILMLLFSILFEYFSRKNLNALNSNLFALAGTLNFGILSVMLEGGLGQILMLPILALFFFIVFYKEVPMKDFGFIVFLALTLAFSTYLDFIYFFGIIVTATLFLLRIKVGINLKKSITIILSSGLLALLCSWPIVTSLPRLFWERFFGHPGGWNMGRVPTLVDLLGLSVWLPSDSVTNFSNQLILILILSMISFYLVVTVMYSASRDISVIFIAYLITYCAIFVSVYSNSPANNYALFKFGAYFGVFAPILFIEVKNLRISDFKKEKNKLVLRRLIRINTAKEEKKYTLKKEYGISTLSYALVFISLISSTVWSFGWYANRQFSISKETTALMQPYLEKYDVVANGFYGAGFAKLAIMGDLHYLTETRGFKVNVSKGVPERPKIYVLDPGVCKRAARCLATKDGKNFEITLLKSFSEFDVYTSSRESSLR